MTEFWSHMWKRKFRLVGIWLIVMVLVLLRLLVMREVYSSTCVLLPLPLEQVEQSAQGGLGGTSVRSLLAGGGSTDAHATTAFFESGQLYDAVIKELNLGKELLPKSWDDSADKWRGDAPHPGKLRRLFKRHVDVNYNGFTGLLDFDVQWWSAERAQEIAAAMLKIADRLLREAAIADGERRVDELTREMQNVTVSEIGSFLAEETTRAIASLASIRARSGYAFRVVDSPLVPDKKSWPPRLLILILAGIGTAIVEVGIVAGVHARKAAMRDSAASGS